jgi:hypothetical protein
MADGRIVGNAVQPCFKRGRTPEGMQLPVRLQEYILSHFTGILGITANTAYQNKNHALVLVHQSCIGMQVSCPGSFYVVRIPVQSALLSLLF